MSSQMIYRAEEGLEEVLLQEDLVRSAMRLRVCHAMCGTEAAYGATRFARRKTAMRSSACSHRKCHGAKIKRSSTRYSISLHTRYAMCGSNIAYGDMPEGAGAAASTAGESEPGQLPYLPAPPLCHGRLINNTAIRALFYALGVPCPVLAVRTVLLLSGTDLGLQQLESEMLDKTVELEQLECEVSAYAAAAGCPVLT
eukprot:3059316-Rhodomonas_salina.1